MGDAQDGGRGRATREGTKEDGDREGDGDGAC